MVLNTSALQIDMAKVLLRSQFMSVDGDCAVVLTATQISRSQLHMDTFALSAAQSQIKSLIASSKSEFNTMPLPPADKFSESVQIPPTSSFTCL